MVGYAPASGKALLNVLEKHGFSKEELDAAGLLNRFKSDLFRGRMMVPFIDGLGNVIGFTGRVIGNSEPKYLNTPETLLFNKSRFIFGLYQAKEAIRRGNFVVIVEGNMDVISSHQAGVKEAVATSGTAMTEQHLKALSHLTSDIRLAYDSDEAGVKATERAIMMAGDLGIDLSVISDYQGAKDPDELIQKDPILWQKAVAKSTPAVDWLLSVYESKVDLSTVPGKRKYSDVALRLIGYLRDEVERASYQKIVADKLGVSVDTLKSKGSRLEQKLNSVAKKRLKHPKTLAKSDHLKKLEDSLLAIKLFGGITGVKIPLEIPEDDTRLAELELIFESEHHLDPASTESNNNTDTNTGNASDFTEFSSDLELEATELLKLYLQELSKQSIAELNARLFELNEDDPEYEKIIKEIRDLQKQLK